MGRSFRCVPAVLVVVAMMASDPAAAQYRSNPVAVPVDAQPATLVQSAIVRHDEVESAEIREVVSVSPDGHRALLIAGDEGLDVWAAAFSFWPEAAVLILIIIGALLVRRTSRLRRLPRGVPCCAVCGYLIHDMTPRCPECGIALTARALRYGGPARVHVALTVLIFVLVVGAYPLFQRALPRESEWVAEHARWYSPALAEKLRDHFPEWSGNYIRWPESIVEFDVETGKVSRTLHTAQWDLSGAMAAPGRGGRLAMVSDGERVIVLDTESQPWPKVVYRAAESTRPELIGFSADARRLYYYELESGIQSVCSLDLATSKVTRLKAIPASGGGCFGPSGPYVKVDPRLDLAIVQDYGAMSRGEAPLRLLDLKSGQWAEALDRTGDCWRARFTSDGSAAIAIDWQAELPVPTAPGARNLLVYWPLDDPQSPVHVIVPFDGLDELVAIDAAGPRAWRLVASHTLESGECLLLARYVEVGEDGSLEVADHHRLVSWPAECSASSWSDAELELRGAVLECRRTDRDGVAAALLVYDLDLPPLDAGRRARQSPDAPATAIASN